MAKISRQFDLDVARSVAATGVTPALNVSLDDGYCIETVFSGLAPTASGTCVLQISVGGVAFADYNNSSQNFASGTKSLVWEVSPKRHKFARIKFSASAGASGTATTTYAGETFVE